MLSPPTVGSSGWRDRCMKSRLPTIDEVSDCQVCQYSFPIALSKLSPLLTLVYFASLA
jgi:hypothetical protein